MGPAQVEIANDLLSLSNDEAYRRASHIVDKYEKNRLNNINGFMDDKYGFIDEPIYRDALNILDNIKENT
jgi:citrate lyase subunit beta/citryl-CoA lyase